MEQRGSSDCWQKSQAKHEPLIHLTPALSPLFITIQPKWFSEKKKRQSKKILHLDILDEVTLGNNNAGTFVATNQWKLGWEWPVAVDGVQISVAHTGVLDVDEDLIWAGLLDIDLLVLNWASGLLNDHGHLLLWDFLGHDCGID